MATSGISHHGSVGTVGPLAGRWHMTQGGSVVLLWPTRPMDGAMTFKMTHRLVADGLSTWPTEPRDHHVMVDAYGHIQWRFAI